MFTSVSVAKRKLHQGPKGGKSLGPMLPTDLVTRYGAWLVNRDWRVANSDWRPTVLTYCVLLDRNGFDFYRNYWNTLENSYFIKICH